MLWFSKQIYKEYRNVLFHFREGNQLMEIAVLLIVQKDFFITLAKNQYFSSQYSMTR